MGNKGWYKVDTIMIHCYSFNFCVKLSSIFIQLITFSYF